MATKRYEENPATGRRVLYLTCCGVEFWCGGFTNTCDTCGRDYNWAGQQLASRSQWGEETGETAADILCAESAGFPDCED